MRSSVLLNFSHHLICSDSLYDMFMLSTSEAILMSLRFMLRMPISQKRLLNFKHFVAIKYYSLNAGYSRVDLQVVGCRYLNPEMACWCYGLWRVDQKGILFRSCTALSMGGSPSKSHECYYSHLFLLTISRLPLNKCTHTLLVYPTNS